MRPLKISDHRSNQQILKSVISDMIGSLSSGLLGYGMGFMLLHNTHSPLSFGLDVAIDPIIDFLLFIPIGNYVDRHNHKHILIVNYILRLILLVLFAMILPRFAKTHQLIPVIIFVAFSEFFGNISDTTYMASVHELVNQHKISALNSNEQACSAGAQFFAPILGVILYSLVSIDAFIAIEFMSTSIAFIIMLTMHFHANKHQRATRHKSIKHRQLHDFKVGVNYIKKRKLIQDLMIIAVIANLFAPLLEVAPSYIIVDKLHLPNEVVSFLDSGLILGIVIGSICVNLVLKKVKFFLKLIISFMVIGVCTMALGLVLNYTGTFWPTTIFGVMGTIVIGLALSLTNVSVAIKMQSTIPTKLMGRVGSTLTAINTVCMPIGTLLFSFLLKFFNNDTFIFIIDGGLLIAYFLICSPKFFRDIKLDDKYFVNKDSKVTFKKVD